MKQEKAKELSEGKETDAETESGEELLRKRKQERINN